MWSALQQKARLPLVAAAVASVLINILYLNSSLFMIQVYDRVLISKSISTLVSIFLICLIVFVFHGLFEVLRSRIFNRIASMFDAQLNERVYRQIVLGALSGRIKGDGLEPLRDMDHVRNFLSGPGLPALMDLPWVIIYVGLCFSFSPVYGLVCIVGMVVMAGIAFGANMSSRHGARWASGAAGKRNAYASLSQKNAEVIVSMGMMPNLVKVWAAGSTNYRNLYLESADVLNGYAIVTKIFRIALQSTVLAVGAVLVLDGDISSGVMIAASIVTARALSPVEQIVAHWKGITDAQNSWGRIKVLLGDGAGKGDNFELPRPIASLEVVELEGAVPGKTVPIFSGVTFSLRAGNALGVVGPSASGKSSFAKCLLQLWPQCGGTVRLDDSELAHWDSELLGASIGYLPQDVELFSGTVVQNISRFDPHAATESVIAAAKAAGVHDMICRLPHGYKTEIGTGGAHLSAGQRQRLGLARALYGDPFLVVLDEPNSNLDQEGEKELANAILGIKIRGGIAIVITHRQAVLSCMDHILVMENGRMKSFGPLNGILGAPAETASKKFTIVVRDKVVQ